MSADRVFVDTNVIVYRFDDAEPHKQAVAKRLLVEEMPNSHVVVSTQVLQELYVALTRGSDPIASPDIAERAVREASAFMVVQVDAPMIFEAIGEARSRSISFWDALIVRAALSAGCSRLLSEDMNAGERIGRLTVENPFAAEVTP